MDPQGDLAEKLHCKGNLPPTKKCNYRTFSDITRFTRVTRREIIDGEIARACQQLCLSVLFARFNDHCTDMPAKLYREVEISCAVTFRVRRSNFANIR